MKGKCLSRFIALTANPLLYPVIKNQMPRRQKAAVTVSMMPIGMLIGCVKMYRWVMANSMTDDDARSVPIFGFSAMMR